MIPIFAIIVTIVLVLIPATPLFIYVLGCLLPKEHTVSRTRTYKDTTAEEIWQILINVEQYSVWQPTLERIDVQCQEQDDGQRVYTEYTARNKRITTIIDNNKIVKRITEEDSAVQKKKPTFVGTWTFEISTTTTGAIVQITEEGSISRPMVRLLHLVLLGFHRRLDRFLKDLGRRIAEQNKHRQKPEEVLPPSPPLKEVSHEADKNITGVTMDSVQEDWDLMSEIYEKPAASAPA